MHKIKEWREMGYHVKLIFLSLPSADVAVTRVASRVTQGGHNVPEDVIRRRFAQGLHYFNTFYKTSVDAWVLYDNSGNIPVLLEWGENNER